MNKENRTAADTIATLLPESSLAIGKVSRLSVEAGAAVRVVGMDAELSCLVLTTSDRQGLNLCEGDEVVVWVRAAGQSSVILGLTGPPRLTDPDVQPDELVLEARQSLTLRVGDGSITIREDGKILIKGKDLVSHATRRNRIKGGSVEIN